mmetsp:Transcript_3402/g.7783  ORF Transcript_3402/g.7783 Transcript_3402/m.7783 type:complete len:106 (+) Transcript_3402:182-499(+)
MSSLFPILQTEPIESEHWNDFHGKYGQRDVLGDSPHQHSPSNHRRKGSFLISLITLCCLRQSTRTSDPSFEDDPPNQSSTRHMQAWSSTAATATRSTRRGSHILL